MVHFFVCVHEPKVVKCSKINGNGFVRCVNIQTVAENVRNARVEQCSEAFLPLSFLSHLIRWIRWPEQSLLCNDVYLFISMSCALCLLTWCSLNICDFKSKSGQFHGWCCQRGQSKAFQRNINWPQFLVASLFDEHILMILSFKSMLSEIRKWITVKLMWKLLLNADCDDLQGAVFILLTENWFSHVENHTKPMACAPVK